MNNIDYGALYGVKSGESDFSGAIERSLEEGVKHLDKEFLDAIKKFEDEQYKWMAERKAIQEKLEKELKEYFDKNPEAKTIYENSKRLSREADGLIIEYNRRMKDDKNYPDKDAVRRWYWFMSQKYIDKGAQSYKFLYPDFIGPIDISEKFNHENNN